MRKSKFIIALGLTSLFSLPILAQSWIDQIPSGLRHGTVEINLSNWNYDEILFDKLNEYRVLTNPDQEALPLDTNGLYSQTQVQLQELLSYDNQYGEITPIHKNDIDTDYKKTIIFTTNGKINSQNQALTSYLIKSIQSEHVDKTLSIWTSDPTQKSVPLLEGRSAAAAMKIIFNFKEVDDQIEISWKAASAYTINILPDNIVRSTAITPLKKEH